MAHSSPSHPEPQDPARDPLLASVPTVEGYKVLGKTILLDVIGTGGMGVVYRGWHMSFHIDLAVKVLKPELAADRDYVRRFRREAQAALKITHQNVVRAYDVEELHGLHYLVMEYVDGESAWQRVGRLGRLSPAEAQTVFTSAATGLAEAHAHGLVHRDVKPGNLLIARSGRVKLADLGLVQPAIDGDDAGAGDGGAPLLGTPRYLAPEQWESAPAQASADVWALGATLYYLATGHHGLPRLPKAELRRWVREQPFPTLSGVLRTMPELNAIFERCVQCDPAARFATAGELCQALLALGPGDENLLRAGAAEVSPAARRPLPPNEVLGRIDQFVRRGASAAPARSPVRQTPSVAPAVVTKRRHVAAARQRRGSGGLIVVVVLAAIAIIGSILYLRSAGHRTDDAVPATKEQGAVTPPPTNDPAAGAVVAAPPPRVPEPAASPVPVAAVKKSEPSPPTATTPAVAVVEAAATEPAPKSASVRETLQDWLAHSGDASHVALLPRHLDALRRSRAVAREQATAPVAELPHPIEACLASFDGPMQAYPAIEPGSVPPSAVDELLADVGAMRRQGESIEPLLPYLLLLQKNDAADPRVAFCVFEALAVEALDPDGARAAAARVQQLLASAPDSPLRARLPEVVFELGDLGDDGVAMLVRVVQRIAGERPGAPLGPFAVARAFVPELERAYEKAMQAGDVDVVVRCLQAMRDIDPADRGAEVLLAVATGQRDRVTFDYAALTPEQKAAVEARAVHLGLAAIEDQLDVAGALQRLGDASSAQFAFFDISIAARVAAAQSAVKATDVQIGEKRREASRLDNRMRSLNEKTATMIAKGYSEKDIAAAKADAKACERDLAAVRAEVRQLDEAQQSGKSDLRSLAASSSRLDAKRRAFKLQ